jgi:hypothetical protein
MRLRRAHAHPHDARASREAPTRFTAAVRTAFDGSSFLASRKPDCAKLRKNFRRAEARRKDATTCRAMRFEQCRCIAATVASRRKGGRAEVEAQPV